MPPSAAWTRAFVCCNAELCHAPPGLNKEHKVELISVGAVPGTASFVDLKSEASVRSTLKRTKFDVVISCVFPEAGDPWRLLKLQDKTELQKYTGDWLFEHTRLAHHALSQPGEDGTVILTVREIVSEYDDVFSAMAFSALDALGKAASKENARLNLVRVPTMQSYASLPKEVADKYVRSVIKSIAKR